MSLKSVSGFKDKFVNIFKTKKRDSANEKLKTKRKNIYKQIEQKEKLETSGHFLRQKKKKKERNQRKKKLIID